MTLTDIIPSIRRTLPDPLDVDRWPAFTRATTDDLVIAGVSMTGLAQLCETPCVHSCDAVVPGTGGRPSPSEATTVIVATVLATSLTDDRLHAIVTDACLDAIPVTWSEARLIGRPSTAYRRPTKVLTRGANAAAIAELPEDLAAGDLLAIPCPGFVTRRDLRLATREPRTGFLDELPARRLA